MTIPWPFPPENPYGGWSSRLPSEPDRSTGRSAGLAEQVAQRLRLHRRVVGDDVAVQAQNAVVILTGTAPTTAARRTANTLAWQTPGVVDVNDRICVERPEDL